MCKTVFPFEVFVWWFYPTFLLRFWISQGAAMLVLLYPWIAEKEQKQKQNKQTNKQGSWRNVSLFHILRLVSWLHRHRLPDTKWQRSWLYFQEFQTSNFKILDRKRTGNMLLHSTTLRGTQCSSSRLFVVEEGLRLGAVQEDAVSQCDKLIDPEEQQR